jgi:hypothetical protein
MSLFNVSRRGFLRGSAKTVSALMAGVASTMIGHPAH